MTLKNKQTKTSLIVVTSDGHQTPKLQRVKKKKSSEWSYGGKKGGWSLPVLRSTVILTEGSAVGQYH